MNSRVKEIISLPIYILLYCIGVVLITKYFDIRVFNVEIFMLSFVTILYLIIDYE